MFGSRIDVISRCGFKRKREEKKNRKGVEKVTNFSLRLLLSVMPSVFLAAQFHETLTLTANLPQFDLE